MGRLYQKSVSGEITLAYFENGQVRNGKSAADIIINYNDAGQIYKYVANNGHYPIAVCDSSGNIRKGNGVFGLVLAKCEDGVIFEGESIGGRILAHFDGDMYGAAAALAVMVLKWV